ncbi:DUF1415 domain-containing protein [Alteromonas sp. CYL-A6]|uniref:DUF1415 domain-containing protein n=1 Tax=Alteromonas nitratireducens TaxID=3390813 RepID=UPI0034C09145
MNSLHPAIAATRQWLDDIVIKHNFCPFARYVREPERIRYVLTDAGMVDLPDVLNAECKHLDDDNETATTLLILMHEEMHEFDSYLDTLALATQWMSSLGYDGIYQLASFHPDYQFEGEPASAASHYTNRSPYPLFHLIREADIERSLAHYDGDPDDIYTANIATANALGGDYFKDKLDALRACPFSAPKRK